MTFLGIQDRAAEPPDNRIYGEEDGPEKQAASHGPPHLSNPSEMERATRFTLPERQRTVLRKISSNATYPTTEKRLSPKPSLRPDQDILKGWPHKRKDQQPIQAEHRPVSNLRKESQLMQPHKPVTNSRPSSPAPRSQAYHEHKSYESMMEKLNPAPLQSEGWNMHIPGNMAKWEASAPDRRWIEDTIRDIVECSSRLEDICVYTPITTIIGSDLQELSSDPNVKENMTQNIPAKGLLSLSRSEELTKTSNPASPLAACPPKTRSSTSPSLTTSWRHGSEGAAGGIISPAVVWNPRRAATVSQPQVGTDLRTYLPNRQSPERQQILPSSNRNGRSTQLRPANTRSVSKSDWKVQVPGMYPVGAVDDDRIADHLQRIKTGLQYVTMLRFLHGIMSSVVTIVIKLARLYWSTVRPVSSIRSGFWRRHARREATWSDGLVTLLATPGAVLITAGFVWLVNIVITVSTVAISLATGT